MISLRTFSRSLRHALRGLADVARAEHSFRVQLLAAFVVTTLAFVLPLALWQRTIVLLLACAVLVLEVMNSIVERLADAVQPRLSPMVREVKDMMAGMVLLASVTASAIALMIFGPYCFAFLTRLMSVLY